MKKLKLFFTVILMVAAIISCDKRNVELRLESMPEYNGSAILIDTYDGNTSCEVLDGEYLFTSGRANFVNGSFDFSDANTMDWPEGIDPNTGWPNGLSVTVSDDGKYVSFNYTSDNYCIGAVIVKGGNQSNVYTYNPAVKFDINLSSPENSSGLPADLSNLTFCFVECDELVIAIKAIYLDNEGANYCLSDGPSVFASGWCASWPLGVNDYIAVSSFDMVLPITNISVGTAIIDSEGDVKITLNSGLRLYTAYLYVGTLENLQTQNLLSDGCPNYENSTFWKKNTTAETDSEGKSFMFFDL